jgi:hypothetical protein
MGWRLSFSSLQSDWPWAPFSIQSIWLLWVLSPSVMWLHHWADLVAVVFFVEYRDQNWPSHGFMVWRLTKDRETLSMRNTFWVYSLTQFKLDFWEMSRHYYIYSCGCFCYIIPFLHYHVFLLQSPGRLHVSPIGLIPTWNVFCQTLSAE